MRKSIKTPLKTLISSGASVVSNSTQTKGVGTLDTEGSANHSATAVDTISAVSVVMSCGHEFTDRVWFEN